MWPAERNKGRVRGVAGRPFCLWGRPGVPRRRRRAHARPGRRPRARRTKRYGPLGDKSLIAAASDTLDDDWHPALVTTRSRRAYDTERARTRSLFIFYL